MILTLRGIQGYGDNRLGAEEQCLNTWKNLFIFLKSLVNVNTCFLASALLLWERIRNNHLTELIWIWSISLTFSFHLKKKKVLGVFLEKIQYLVYLKHFGIACKQTEIKSIYLKRSLTLSVFHEVNGVNSIVHISF